MKEKIFAALKTEYKNFGLSNEALDRIASIAEKTITKEEEIETSIKDGAIKDLISLMQKESDKLRTDKVSAEKALADYKKEHPETIQPKDEPKDEPDPAIAALQAQVAELKKFNEEKDKAAIRMATRSALETKLREGGCVNDYVRGNVLKAIEIKDGDTADTLFDATKEAYNKEMKLAFGDSYIPQTSNQQSGNYKPGEFGNFKKLMQNEGNLPNE